jgi:uncharacterized Zn-finger protein
MTGREKLNRRVRMVMRVAYLGAGLCVTSFLLGFIGLGRLLPVLFLLGFAMIFISLVFAHSGSIRCPWCRANLSVVGLRGEEVLSFDARIQCCPYCGHRLDEELPQPPE